MTDHRYQNKAIMNIINRGDERRNLTLSQFKEMYSGEWYLNSLCRNCKTILTRPLKNFTECFLELGITGDPELTKACKEFQDAEQKLWQLIDKHDFEFIDEVD